MSDHDTAILSVRLVEAEAEVERLRSIEETRQRGCDCGDDEACQFLRERNEARAEVKLLLAIKDAAEDLRETGDDLARMALSDALDAYNEGQVEA